LLSVFNDAGVGRDAAGIAGLALLEQDGLAGCAVSHDSACIGQAMSTWKDGVVSHANGCALAMGVRPGVSIRQAAAVLGVASLGTNPQKR